MREVSASALAMSNGGYAMVALDQRESLRQMISAGQNRAVSDQDLVSFKQSALDVFGDKPSAVLLDIDYGLPALKQTTVKQAKVILAVDLLIHNSEGRLVTSELATDGVQKAIDSTQPDGLKFLLLWSEAQSAQERLDLAGSFVEFCKVQGLPSVLESIVRAKDAPSWSDPHDAVEAMLKATAELATLKADLYKCEVPGHGLFPVEETTKISREITSLIGSPWVVLSNGVAAKDFPSAVEAACAGGASGFLAGRAIWADAVKEEDPAGFMRDESIKRLQIVTDHVNSAMALRNNQEASA